MHLIEIHSLAFYRALTMELFYWLIFLPYPDQCQENAGSLQVS